MFWALTGFSAALGSRWWCAESIEPTELESRGFEPSVESVGRASIDADDARIAPSACPHNLNPSAARIVDPQLETFDADILLTPIVDLYATSRAIDVDYNHSTTDSLTRPIIRTHSHPLPIQSPLAPPPAGTWGQ